MTDDETKIATDFVSKFINLIEELSESNLTATQALAVAKVYFDSIITVLHQFQVSYGLDVAKILSLETIAGYAERIKAESESDPEASGNLH